MKSKLLKLTELREKHYILLFTNARKSEGIIGEILHIHLVTEFLLEELIRLSLEKQAEAVLSIGLSYSKKLELASKLEVLDGFELLPDYIVGSLRKLNRLRNRVAHRLNEEITNDEIKELFMGLEKELPYGDVIDCDMIIVLRRYLSFIFGCMLPKFEQADE